MPKKIDPAIKERAVRLVRERRLEYPSLTAAEESAEIKALKAKVRRLEEDNAILKAASVFFARAASL